MAHRRFPIRLNILFGCSCDLQVSDGDPGVGKVSGSPTAMMRSPLPVVEVQSETPLAAQTRETEESEQVEKPGASLLPRQSVPVGARTHRDEVSRGNGSLLSLPFELVLVAR